MYHTLLFDLDGTLLDLDMRVFVPKYIEALSRHFSSLVEPARFSEHLLQGVRAMVLNKNPRMTNEEVFLEHFLQSLEISRDELMPQLNDFYHNSFCDLAVYARQQPLARTIMQQAFFKQCDVVIATNPVFPRAAIMHRLRWAGVNDFSYSLVTSYEIMHYCKPHPEYYEEILQVLKLQPRNCLMIGNDTRDDLVAHKAGIKTFLVHDLLVDRGDQGHHADYEGTLEDLHEFIQKL